MKGPMFKVMISRVIAYLFTSHIICHDRFIVARGLVTALRPFSLHFFLLLNGRAHHPLLLSALDPGGS